MKSNQSISWTFNVALQQWEWTIADGGPMLTLPLVAVHDANRVRGMHFGVGQVRVVDGAAVGRADSKGVLRSKAEMLRLKRAGMERIISHLASGSPDWGTGQRASGPDTGLIVEALAQVNKQSADDVRQRAAMRATALNISSDAYLVTLSGLSAVAAAMVEIAAKRQPAAVTFSAAAELAALQTAAAEEDVQGQEPETEEPAEEAAEEEAAE